LGLNGRVKFMGYVPRADLPALFSGATALVYPSLLEGFGLPVVEAMACGTPVITSNNSSMKEVASGAAMLIDPRSVRDMTETLARVAQDEPLRKELSVNGLKRAAEFSWQKTASLTLDAYREAVDRPLRSGPLQRPSKDIAHAVRKTIEYATLFQYPLSRDELRERLFEVRVDATAFDTALNSIGYEPDPKLVALRSQREQITGRAIQEVRPHLHTLAWVPFVRMIAFSGSTAHGNMTTTEDVDLFMVVEEGKLWAVFLAAVLWAKAKGLRKRLCMNYLISDAALPLFEHDVFTAQQVASLKPIYGKSVYDRFIAANPFVSRWFPNFEPSRHRKVYGEIEPHPSKRWFETVLRFGAVQVLERISRLVLGRYLTRKICSDSDVQLDPRRLKLHLHSHKQAVLDFTSSSRESM
jgi:Glycosyl transferases group 1